MAEPTCSMSRWSRSSSLRCSSRSRWRSRGSMRRSRRSRWSRRSRGSTRRSRRSRGSTRRSRWSRKSRMSRRSRMSTRRSRPSLSRSPGATMTPPPSRRKNMEHVEHRRSKGQEFVTVYVGINFVATVKRLNLWFIRFTLVWKHFGITWNERQCK